MHKISLSCDNGGMVYIESYYKLKYNPTCSHDCFVKDATIPCIDCQHTFLKTIASLGCLSCALLIKHKLENYNSRELGNLANTWKKREKRVYKKQTIANKSS